MGATALFQFGASLQLRLSHHFRMSCYRKSICGIKERAASIICNKFPGGFVFICLIRRKINYFQNLLNKTAFSLPTQ